MRRHEAIRQLRGQLLRRREGLWQALDLARGQLEAERQGGVGDQADSAIDSQYNEINSQLAQAESFELKKISTALSRIESGEYGICEDCARNIPMARLQALPYATLCIGCQRAREANPEAEPSARGLPAERTNPDLTLNGNGAGIS